jgi:hypothetical protein
MVDPLRPDGGAVIPDADPDLIPGESCYLSNRNRKCGTCPVCGADLVSNLYEFYGRGFLIRHECINSLNDDPTCDYQRPL